MNYEIEKSNRKIYTEKSAKIFFYWNTMETWRLENQQLIKLDSETVILFVNNYTWHNGVSVILSLHH